MYVCTYVRWVGCVCEGGWLFFAPRAKSTLRVPLYIPLYLCTSVLVCSVQMYRCTDYSWLVVRDWYVVFLTCIQKKTFRLFRLVSIFFFLNFVLICNKLVFFFLLLCWCRILASNGRVSFFAPQKVFLFYRLCLLVLFLVTAGMQVGGHKKKEKMLIGGKTPVMYMHGCGVMYICNRTLQIACTYTSMVLVAPSFANGVKRY